uniref:Uncharacterized protein n=1 Tax=viral metagenome TaxID=1070528 RepID=A0A6M3K1Q5_9ZZZZ
MYELMTVQLVLVIVGGLMVGMFLGLLLASMCAVSGHESDCERCRDRNGLWDWGYMAGMEHDTAVSGMIERIQGKGGEE